MNIIVVGGGKVGYYLTKTLLEHGHSPILIEQNRESCRHAANEDVYKRQAQYTTAKKIRQTSNFIG